jgi:hypothetical protein
MLAFASGTLLTARVEIAEVRGRVFDPSGAASCGRGGRDASARLLSARVKLVFD